MNRVETVLTELKNEILEKRKWAWAEAVSDCWTDLYKKKMAMVYAYDVCLILIDGKLRKGEILKGRANETTRIKS